MTDAETWGAGREEEHHQLYNEAVAHLEDKGTSPGLTIKGTFK